MNASGVALHDGNIPFRCMGTGTARLAVAALQSTESAERQFLIVDELEYGLEPHRISLLVSHLRNRVANSGQVFMTSHSTSVLREVRFDEVFVCRRNYETKAVTASRCSSDIAKILDSKRHLRNVGEALLSRSVLVCEGQTEVALLKGLSEGTGRAVQKHNCSIIDGGGESAPDVALYFKSLGYRTALISDSDEPVKAPKVVELRNMEVRHFEWGDRRCTEQQLLLGLHEDSRRPYIDFVRREIDDEQLCAFIAGACQQPVPDLDTVYELLQSRDQADAIGRWFHKKSVIKKDFDLCFNLGSQFLSRPEITDGTPLGAQLDTILDWLCGDD